jgi:FKBP-type peptidyl-prolyl cis-trans isomerase
MSATGCVEDHAPILSTAAIKPEKLIAINKYLVEKEKEVIELFVRRQGWKMTRTEDGYYCEIFDEGSARKPLAGELVIYRRKVKLLDGTLCYETEAEMPEGFIVDGDDEISGMHRAVRCLGAGACARFIFPQRLAYGLQGDFDRIPPLSALVYTVEIIEIN